MPLLKTKEPPVSDAPNCESWAKTDRAIRRRPEKGEVAFASNGWKQNCERGWVIEAPASSMGSICVAGLDRDCRVHQAGSARCAPKTWPQLSGESFPSAPQPPARESRAGTPGKRCRRLQAVDCVYVSCDLRDPNRVHRYCLRDRRQTRYTSSALTASHALKNYTSFALSISFTAAGFACPLLSFITWPTR